MPARRCAVYARISVTSDESVSIARQVEAAEQYAAARGWQVVATFTDDGVSATHNKPEQRAGWRELLASPARFDAVVVWKVDRLARRVLDFLHADEALQRRGAGLVAVEQSIDMTSAEGRMVAQVLAVFGEYEAAAISSRVAAARDYLIKAGRVPSGKPTYGWRSVPNPAGPGYVLAQDPDHIGYVRGMVDRVTRGDSIYSVKQWLADVGAPTPTGRGAWQYSTVERILRHPILAGMTPHNPGNTARTRGAEVLRGDDGLPVVLEDVALMPVAAWRAMVGALDQRDSSQSKPVAMRSKTSALLSGLVYCGEHADGAGTRMRRGTVNGRPGYYCPVCHQSVSNFEDAVIAEFMRQKGDHVRWTVVTDVHEGGAADLPEIEVRLTELGARLQATDDDDVADGLTRQIAGLRKLRRERRAEPAQVRQVFEPAGHYDEDWAAAESPEDRRAVLDDALARLWVVRGRPGRRPAGAVLERLVFEWKQPSQVGSTAQPAD